MGHLGSREWVLSSPIPVFEGLTSGVTGSTGINQSHFIVSNIFDSLYILSRATQGKVTPNQEAEKVNKKRIIVKNKEFCRPIHNTLPTR